MPTKNRKKRKASVSKHFDTRKQALHAFKKDYNIPRTEQPKEVVKPFTPQGERHNLDNRNVRLYIFQAVVNLFKVTTRRKTYLREDKEAFYVKERGTQDSHFNAGHANEKLRDHYYFGKKKKS